MANLLTRLQRKPRKPSERYGLDWLSQQMAYDGHVYPLQTTWGHTGDSEQIGTSFAQYVQSGYAANGVVFACILTRLLVFAEARFQWRRMQNGRPGDLFGDQTLQVLEEPWPNGTTGELLARMEQDVSLAGNSFWWLNGGQLVRLRPDWVSIVHGGSDSLRRTLLGYLYRHDGEVSRTELLPVSEVAHYSPIPDPLASWRGMSWLTPVLREVDSDKAMTRHKLKFFDNAATPNLALKFDPTITASQIEEFRQIVESEHAGWNNAYKTLYLGGGADPVIVGSTMEQMSFKTTQGAGETRIAAAAGVPPVLVGLSEGLQSATYSNYGMARRRFADGTVRPLWRIAAASLEKILPGPPGAELWYDDRDIPFLREDDRDAAEILSTNAGTIRSLVDAGYKPDSAVQAVEAGDLRLLTGQHTNLFSVQLQEPGQKSNGNGPAISANSMGDTDDE